MRIKILREEYCARCKIKAFRSTGVKLLLQSVKEPPRRVLDFGCSTWRNSKYLEDLGAYVVKADAFPDSKPDIIAYPAYMPVRDSVFDVVLFTHIFMFLESKRDWPTVAEELKRITRKYIVVETYRVKNRNALEYSPEEVENLFTDLVKIKRHARRDMQNYVFMKEMSTKDSSI